jgi:hypothetical protein
MLGQSIVAKLDLQIATRAQDCHVALASYIDTM